MNSEDYLKVWRLRDAENGEKDFVPDGIINPDRWKGVNPKILFVLKEPSQRPETPNHSMCEYFLKCGATGHFLFLSEVAWGIQEFSAGHNRSYEDAKGSPQKHGALLRTGFINLRKLPGGAVCNNPRFKKNINLHKDDIINQIEIIAPKIVICCGTFDLIKKCVLPDLRAPSTTTDYCAYVSDQLKKTVFIKTCHPQASRWKLNGIMKSGNKVKYDDILAACVKI